jgi:pimeloyl-ACP methyl ester carboxylesterase
LVHGNGPQDRDQTVGPNKPFKDIAWGLASRGIAVLRYDKRTAACNVDLADATIDQVVTTDAVTALERLGELDRVGERFVLGHSFGGLLAPRIASRAGGLAGVVMLAPGPARPIADAIVAQQEHLANLDGEVTPAEERALERVRELAEKIRSLSIEDDAVVANLGGDEFYRTLREYDYGATARELDAPLFLAQGGRDWQVTVEEDLALWRDALAEKSNAEIEVYPKLNHMFQLSTGKMTQREYVEPDNHVAERLVADVAAFVDERV